VVTLDLMLPAVLAFVAVGLGTLAVVLVSEILIAQRRRNRMLRQLANGPAALHDALVPSNLLQERNSPASLAERLAARFPLIRGTRFRLQRAGVTWSVSTYLVATAGLGATFFLTGWLASGGLLVAVLASAFGASIPRMYVAHRRRKKLRAFEEQFPEAIDLLGRAVRAGHPLTAGLRTVAEEAPEPLASEFRQIFEEQRFGLPFEDALLAMTDRNELVDARIFVTAVLVQRDVGGNLAEILDKLAKTIRARFSIFRQLRVYTAQGRMSGYVVSAMPVVVGSAVYMIDPDYVRMLFIEPAGRLMLGTAIVMQVVGFLWIRKIVDIEI